jgi:hypothetical protein
MNVPPSMDMEKTVIGVGKREIGIMVVALLLGVIAGFLLPVPFELVYLRVGVGLFILLLGLAVAIARDPRSKMTLEQMLFSVLAYRSRARHRQLNFDPQASQRPSGRGALSKYLEGHEGRPVSPSSPREGEVVIRALDLGHQLFFSIIAFTGLAMFITWLFVGGGAELKALVDLISPFPRNWSSLFIS